MQIFAYSDQEKLISVEEALKGVDYLCPGCKGRVRLKRGFTRKHHFFHVGKKPCRFSQKGNLHLQIQLQLKKKFPSSLLEARFPTIDRIADLYVPNDKLIFEVQCSPISPQEALSRNADYAKLGLTVHWILFDGRYRGNHPVEKLLPLVSYTDGERIYQRPRLKARSLFALLLQFFI